MAALNYRGRPNNLHAPTQKIIDLFHHQRMRRSQFALLYISPCPLRYISADNLTFVTQDGEVDAPYEATDWSQPLFPSPGDRNNYIAARPERKRHTETMLMDAFESLLESYEESSSVQCRSVLLYSWFHPCFNCACKISETLEDFIDDGLLEVAVVHSCDMRGFGGKEESRSRLEMAGIKVLQETSDQYIEPAQRKDRLF